MVSVDFEEFEESTELVGGHVKVYLVIQDVSDDIGVVTHDDRQYIGFDISGGVYTGLDVHYETGEDHLDGIDTATEGEEERQELGKGYFALGVLLQ